MPIYFNDHTKEFHLQGKGVSYILTILRNNQLGHLYYGKKIRQRESFSHLLKVQARAGEACVYEGDLEFSLDIIKQEFPSYGTSDFREPAFQIRQENGSRITNFEYKDHKIFKGKPTLENLPATYVESDDEATTLEISLFDDLIQAEMILQYSIYENLDVITRMRLKKS